MWHRLQALGELKAMRGGGRGRAHRVVAARMRANSVMGMWQEMHSLPRHAGLVMRVGGHVATVACVTGQAGLVGRRPGP